MSDLIQDNYIFLNENHKSKEIRLRLLRKKRKNITYVTMKRVF